MTLFSIWEICLSGCESVGQSGFGQRTVTGNSKGEARRWDQIAHTTILVDWERPEADELRPDAEAMEEESVLPETERC